MISGELAGAAAVAAGTAVVSWFVPQSTRCVGQDVRVRYVVPRHRVIPLASVRGMTSEKGIWITRLELTTGYPVVFPGQLQRKLEQALSRSPG